MERGVREISFETGFRYYSQPESSAEALFRKSSTAQDKTEHLGTSRIYEIRQDDLSGRATQALLELHLAGMYANSPAENVFALDISGLKAPGVTVWTAWAGDAIAGIGALKDLGDRGGEIKSMRTHPDHLRKGVASALLEHIITQARLRGFTRLSLETGRGPAFEPALLLYKKRGFTYGPAFADYRPSDFSQFLHLAL